MVTDQQLRTYIGSEVIFDGVTYRWQSDRYIIVNPLRRSTADAFGQVRKVTVPFIPQYLSTTNPILPAEVDVYVDDVLWDNISVEKTTRSINITFDETYILNQRIISFSSQRARTYYRYAIRARVNDENDVVIIEFGNDEMVPTIGTPDNRTVATATQPTSPTTDPTPSPAPTEPIFNDRIDRMTSTTSDVTITPTDIPMTPPTTLTTRNTIRNIQ